MTSATASGIVHSLVIPVYRNEGNIPALLEALAKLAGEIDRFEVVFVVDGSPDRSAQKLAEGLQAAPFAWQPACHDPEATYCPNERLRADPQR